MVPQGAGGGADHAGGDHPAERGEQQDQGYPAAFVDDGEEDSEDEEGWYDEGEVGEPGEEAVGEAGEVSGDGADYGGDAVVRTATSSPMRRDLRRPTRVMTYRSRPAAVGSEPVACGGWLQEACVVAFGEAPWCGERAEPGEQGEQDQQPGSHQDAGVAEPGWPAGGGRCGGPRRAGGGADGGMVSPWSLGSGGPGRPGVRSRAGPA